MERIARKVLSEHSALLTEALSGHFALATNLTSAGAQNDYSPCSHPACRLGNLVSSKLDELGLVGLSIHCNVGTCGIRMAASQKGRGITVSRV